MKLKITAIRDAGNLEKERVVMKALEPVNIGDFTLLQTGFSNGKVNIGVKQTYWFPNKQINAGDFIVVYTKKGTINDKDFNDVKSHFFYWGLTGAIWDSASVASVLLYSPEWITYREEEVPE